MGCQMSSSQVESLINQQQNYDNAQIVVKSVADLITFINNSIDGKIKCVFVFGDIGSSKGEIIFELINKERHDWNCIYIDTQTLIIHNIHKRLEELSPNQNFNFFLNKDDSENQLSIESSKLSSLNIPKEYLKITDNIITGGWILKLLNEKIKSFIVNDDYNKTFIINLIPECLHQFKNCLYLKQGINFSTFSYPFIAINILKHENKKKDVDQIINSLYEDSCRLFIDNFRNMNKLIDIKFECTNKIKHKEINIKISRNDDAIKVKNVQHLEQLIKLRQSKDDILQIDITNFQDISSSKGSLFFLDNDVIYCGSQAIIIDASETNMKAVSNFVHFYMKVN